MKLTITLSAVVFLSMINMSCSESTSPTGLKQETATVSDTEKDHDTFKPTKNMVKIHALGANFTAKVGQQFYYSASVHGSVGYTASAVSSDETKLPLSDQFIEYNDKKKAGMPGGDAASKYFIFDALEAGTYEILTQRHFRGDLEEEHTITVTVTD